MSGIMSMLLGAVSSAAAAADEFFNRVTLLLNTGSTNGAQNNTFLDSSSNAFSITRNGNTTQGTFTPFSQTGWSAYFSGSNDYLLQNSTSNWNFLHNGSSWTIQFSLYHSSTALTVLTSTANASAQVGFSLQLNGTVANDVTVAFFRGVNGSSISFSSTANLVINTWNQVGITFDGTTKTCTFYINGVQRGSSSNTGFAYSSSNSAYGLYIGTEANTLLYDFAGYLSNYRISNTVRTGMTSTLTQPFTSDSNTSLLLFQANRFFDAGNNSYTISTGGTPSVQAFSPFAPTAAYSTTTVGGSGYFDGTGDTLATAATTTFDFSTGNFTIATWVYITSFATEQGVVSSQNNGTASTIKGWVLNIGTAGTISFSDFNNGAATFQIVSSSNAVKLNQWHFIVAEKRGTGTNQFQLFVDGVSVASATSSGSIPANTSNNPLTIGNWRYSTDTNREFTGYLSNLKIDNTAIYNGTVSIPTSPFTSGANTQLLTNFTNAGIYDAAAKNVLETVGGAQVSTTAKFGTTSMSFDGTGDYLTIPNGPIVAVGSGDFTIECWWYPTDLSASSSVWCLGDERTANNGLLLYWSSGSSKLVVYSNGASVITSSISTPINSWYYLSVVRSGSGANNLTLYINGSSAGTATNTTSFTGVANNGFAVCAEYAGSFVAGKAAYFDDVRITKGYARPSTTPTAAFPTQ